MDMPTDDAGLTTYEQERNARIAANKQLMDSLGLHDGVSALQGAAGEFANVLCMCGCMRECVCVCMCFVHVSAYVCVNLCVHVCFQVHVFLCECPRVECPHVVCSHALKRVRACIQ